MISLEATSGELLDLLVCLYCGSGLRVSDECRLGCVFCGHTYSAEGGVYRLVDPADLPKSPSKSFGFQWSKWLAGGFEQDQIYGMTLDKELAEFFKYTGLKAEDLPGKKILDAGCGAGRLTRALAKHGAMVVGLDIHSGLADVGRHSVGIQNLLIVHGSILRPPLKSDSFDVVWSEGVIHHTGDTSRAFDQLARLVKPGGCLTVWVYWDQELNLYRRVRNLLRIGHNFPMPVLFITCYALATLFTTAAALRALPGLLTGRRNITSIKLHAFRLFDHISPRYNTQHSESELAGWYARNGFERSVRVADLGMRGFKRIAVARAKSSGDT
jgi:SAM-dependent methyltransferase